MHKHGRCFKVLIWYFTIPLQQLIKQGIRNAKVACWKLNEFTYWLRMYTSPHLQVALFHKGYTVNVILPELKVILKF